MQNCNTQVERLKATDLFFFSFFFFLSQTTHSTLVLSDFDILTEV